MQKKTIYDVNDVSSISVWSDLTIYTDSGDQINIKLSLSDKKHLHDALGRKIKEQVKREAEQAKEDLEELELTNADSDD
jgi:hypothetical protein